MSNVEMTYLRILADGPKWFHEIEDDARTWDYLAEDMAVAWRSLVLSGAVRQVLFGTKWRMTRRGKRLMERCL